MRKIFNNKKCKPRARTLKSHNNGNFELEFGCRLYDALRDDVAAHNAAENVDENRVNFGLVGGDDSKRLVHLIDGRAAANVEEVCGLAAVQLDDVHRRHRKTGAIDCKRQCGRLLVRAPIISLLRSYRGSRYCRRGE